MSTSFSPFRERSLRPRPAPRPGISPSTSGESARPPPRRFLSLSWFCLLNWSSGAARPSCLRALAASFLPSAISGRCTFSPVLPDRPDGCLTSGIAATRMTLPPCLGRLTFVLSSDLGEPLLGPLALRSRSGRLPPPPVGRSIEGRCNGAGRSDGVGFLRVGRVGLAGSTLGLAFGFLKLASGAAVDCSGSVLSSCSSSSTTGSSIVSSSTGSGSGALRTGSGNSLSGALRLSVRSSLTGAAISGSGSWAAAAPPDRRKDLTWAVSSSSRLASAELLPTIPICSQASSSCLLSSPNSFANA